MTDANETQKNGDMPGRHPLPEPSIIDAPTPDAEAQFVTETAMRSRHARLGRIVAGGVAVALIAAAGAYALWRGRPAPPALQKASVSETSAAPQPGGVTTDAPTPPALDLGTATGTLAPGNPSSEASSSAIPQVRPPGSAAPMTPRGAPLGRITRPPEKTMGMLVVPKGFTLASYTVVFQPYGWGPRGESGGQLLVRIVSAAPINASARSFKKDFAGRNASVWCAPKVAAAVSAGGTYRGVLQVRPQGDVGVLFLGQAELVK